MTRLVLVLALTLALLTCGSVVPSDRLNRIVIANGCGD
jgi:hypothetical protein